MSICHSHNLVMPLADAKRFGIRVTLKDSDPFRNLIGNDWQREHWFATAAERDAALVSMSEKYVYFRPGDQPTLTFTTVEK